VVLAIGGSDRQIIDAGDPYAHQALRVELPVLIAVGAEVLTAVVVPLVGEAYCDPIAVECPELLEEAVVQLACPLARQKGHDLGPAVDELSPITPAAVLAVGKRDRFWIAAVSGILGHPNFLGGRLRIERGKRRAWHGILRNCDVITVRRRHGASSSDRVFPQYTLSADGPSAQASLRFSSARCTRQ